MAHLNQERWSKLVDAKLRNVLVTRDNMIFNNRYEGDPKAGKVKIPVRDTEVAVKTYNKATGVDLDAGSTAYIDLAIDQDEAVNELIDGYDAASVPDGIVAERLDSAGYSMGLSVDKKSINALEARPALPSAPPRPPRPNPTPTSWRWSQACAEPQGCPHRWPLADRLPRVSGGADAGRPLHQAGRPGAGAGAVRRGGPHCGL